MNSYDLEFNILDANTFEFTLPLDVSSSGNPEGNYYNDTYLIYEVELNPNNSQLFDVISDKITFTDNIVEIQEGELYSINDDNKDTISFQIDNFQLTYLKVHINFRLKDQSHSHGGDIEIGCRYTNTLLI